MNQLQSAENFYIYGDTENIGDKMNHFLTILTPTYNRQKCLPRLYNSLLAQSNRDFRWLVIDDGSTDRTEQMVAGWIAERKIDIVYTRKANGGKHTALNYGISMTDDPLLFIVDSDDYLKENAVAVIKEYSEKYSGQKAELKLCGYSFLRAYSNGTINSIRFSADDIVDTYRNERINRKDIGDKAEVYYTDVLKKYPFQVFAGEKFLPEDTVWIRMSGPYQMVHVNQVIYICDYLEGGLTKTGRYMKVHSPYGMMCRSAAYLNDNGVIVSVRMKMLLLYVIYEYFAGKNGQKNASAEEYRIKKGVAYRLLKIPGFVLYLRWCYKYKDMK